MDERTEPRRSLALHSISVALWGASVGVLLCALCLLPLMRELVSRSAAQDEFTWLTGFYARPPWQAGFQKWMYLLHGVCAPLIAWLCLRWSARLNGCACFLAFACFIPVISKVYKGTFEAEPRPVHFLAAAIILAIPLIDWERLLGPIWLRIKGSPGSESETSSLTAQPAEAPRTRALYVGMVLLVGLLFLVLWPRKIHGFADAFANEIHLASYVFGPALCFQDAGKVPGLDFESHYGVGHAYVFSFFMGSNYHEALCSYLWFAFAVLAFYFVSAYVVMASWFRAPRTAFVATLVLLALSMECLSYRWPSCWPIRFPFLFVFLASASCERLLGQCWLAVLVAGACAGLSFFWQTDNGMVVTVAGAAFYAVLSVRERQGWWRAPLFLGGGAATVAGLSLVAFGPRTLSAAYYQGLFAPVLEYSSGFGWHLMRWHFGWTYLYNLIGPMVALATLGLCVHRFGLPDPEDKREARFLFLASAVGLVMLFKWVNRAMDLAWTMNAAAITFVLFWWIRCAVLAAASALERRSVASPRWLGGLRWHNLIGAACVVGLVGIGWLVGRLQSTSGMTQYSDSPVERFASFTLETPTPVNWLVSRVKKVNTLPPLGPQIADEDVEFIRRHTDGTAPVAILAPLDWVYLSEAQRVPAFHWVPVYYTHTHANVERVTQNLKQAHCVFVQRDSLDFLKTLQPSLHERLVPILDNEFTLVDSGKALDRYVRRQDAHAAIQP